jgi:hypothetical protein
VAELGLEGGAAGLGHRGGGEIVERVADIEGDALGLAGGVEEAELAEVAVAGEEKDTGGAGVADELEEAAALVREVAPFLEAVAVGDDLEGGNDEAEVGGLAKAGFEPGPLVLAEEGGSGVGLGEVAAACACEPFVAGAVALVEERGTKVAGVEDDELDDATGRAEAVGGVDAGAGAAGGIGGDVVEIEEVLLGFGAAHEVGAGVVGAVVMVVPGADDLGAFAQVGVGGEVFEQVVVVDHAVEGDTGAGLGSGADGAGGVGVDGVAEPDPDVGESVGDGGPDGGVIERGVAGAEGDALDEGVGLGRGFVGAGGGGGGEDED